MKGDVKLASSAAVAASVAIAYLVFLARSFALSDWNHLTQLEQLIFETQILRVVVVAYLQRYPRFNPVIPMILFSLEVFLIPCFGLLEYLTGNPVYTIIMGQVLTTWIGVSALVLTPFAIYQFFVTMVRGSPLVNVILFGTMEIGSLSLIAEILSFVHTKITGPSALGTVIAQDLGSKLQAKFAGLGSNLTLEASLTMFFVGMIVYLVSSRGYTKPTSFLYPFIVFLLGSVALFVWTGVSRIATANILFVFTVPILVLATAVWVSAHGK